MDHLKFSKIDIDYTERRKRNFPGYKWKSKPFNKHGNYIKESIEKNINNVKEKSKNMKFNPYLVMKINLEDGVSFSEDEQQKLDLYGLKIIDAESNQLQVVFSDDINLKLFKEQLNKYSNGEKAKTKICNQDLFEKIKSISEWGYSDRKIFKTKKVTDNSYFDVYLWVFDTIKESTVKMNEFINFVILNGGKVPDKYIGNSVVVARIKVNNEVLEKILHNPLVYKVDDIEKITFKYNNIEKIKNTEIKDIKYDNSKIDPDNSPGICVIDSGIYEQHPLLKGVIGDSKTFFINDSNDSSTSDMDGHGTGVASVCEYGDFKYNQKFIPTIYIFNAKIHNGQYDSPKDLLKREIEDKIEPVIGDKLDNYMRFCDGDLSFDDFLNCFNDEYKPFIRMTYSKYANMYEKLIPTQMREIVDYFYTTYGCRIYNLSQGDLNNIYIGDKPKAWCCILDELQNEKDIIFVISAGNYKVDKYNIEEISNNYPRKFFEMQNYRIIEPANSVNSITVGSIAISDVTMQNPSYHDMVNRRAITQKDQLSIITRVGPGVGNSIKPEFVAYGGDVGIKENILKKKEPLFYDKGISKLLFINDGKNIFTWSVGTSFAAPYVSYLAAKVLERYNTISNNMIRALLANAAKYPTELIDLIKKCKNLNTTFNKEFTYNYRGTYINNYSRMLCYTAGYGFPDIDECLESEDNRVVLMADMVKDSDKIKVDEINVFEVPLPYEFRKSKGTKTVSVTLAYNPKVRNTRSDYIGTHLEFNLIKGKSLDQVIQMCKKQKKDESVSLEGTCNTIPSAILRSRGTLQKGIFKFEKDVNFNNENLFVVVSCKKNWDIDSQKYALVVSLRAEDNIQLYDIVRDKLNIKVRAKRGRV